MMEGPGADSEEKRVLASDLDTVMVDSLKALDLSRPIREADMNVQFCCDAQRISPSTMIGCTSLLEGCQKLEHHGAARRKLDEFNGSWQTPLTATARPPGRSRRLVGEKP